MRFVTTRRVAALLACALLAASSTVSAQDAPPKPAAETAGAAPAAPVNLDSYVGTYQVGDMVFTISRVGEKLMGTAPGHPPLELLAQGPGQYAVPQMGARL